jgi:hypothetical protein
MSSRTKQGDFRLKLLGEKRLKDREVEDDYRLKETTHEIWSYLVKSRR